MLVCVSACTHISLNPKCSFQPKPSTRWLVKRQNILGSISFQSQPWLRGVEEEVNKKRILEQRLCLSFRDDRIPTTGLIYYGAEIRKQHEIIWNGADHRTPCNDGNVLGLCCPIRWAPCANWVLEMWLMNQGTQCLILLDFEEFKQSHVGSGYCIGQCRFGMLTSVLQEAVVGNRINHPSSLMEDMGPRGAWSCHLSSRKENKPALLSGVKTIRSPKAQPTSPQATSLFLPFANKGHSRPTKSPKYERCSICFIWFCFWLSCFGSYFTVLVVNFLFWSSGIYVNSFMYVFSHSSSVYGSSTVFWALRFRDKIRHSPRLPWAHTILEGATSKYRWPTMFSAEQMSVREPGRAVGQGMLSAVSEVLGKFTEEVKFGLALKKNGKEGVFQT